MKQTRHFVFISVITFLSFIAISFFSCKTACDGVACQNNGTCTGGTCTCPSGYSGNLCQQSSLTYINDTYTPVTITLNGVANTIPSGSTYSYIGNVGTAAIVTAYTFGASPAGAPLGDSVTWAFTDTFPTGGVTPGNLPLDAPSSYFYLKIINNNPQTVVAELVNYQLSNQVTDSVSIPGNGIAYGLGYYPASASTQVYTSFGATGQLWNPSALNLPGTSNQSTTIVVPN